MQQFDILVIGGGPGGYSLAINAAKRGCKVALFEKEHVGGTCLNVGCIPTKYLVDKAIAMEKVRSLVDRGIFRDAGSFSFRKIQQGKSEVTGKLVGGVQFLMKKHGVELVSGTAQLKADRVVACNGQEYQGKHVVIATGSEPMMIPVPGHEHCIDSTGALGLQKLPRSMGRCADRLLCPLQKLPNGLPPFFRAHGIPPFRHDSSIPHARQIAKKKGEHTLSFF